MLVVSRRLLLSSSELVMKNWLLCLVGLSCSSMV